MVISFCAEIHRGSSDHVKPCTTIHLIKKLTFYARCTGTGMGVLQYRYGHCISHIVRLKSKQDGGICLARQFRTSVGSEIDVDRTEKRKL